MSTLPTLPIVSSFNDRITVGTMGHIQKYTLTPDLQKELRNDPRGILWLWEPPQKRAQYIVGIDPTEGITGWSRYHRTSHDNRVNNGVVEVVRFANNRAYQVAEYAAPIDSSEIGYVANIVGRIYNGSEEDQAKVILETHPGPGTLTLRQMIELGYGNFWNWEYYGEKIPEQTQKVGWSASNQSIRDLWAKSSRELCLNNVDIKSPWLVEEYADQVVDPGKGYAVSPNNTKGHGDRVRAMNLALWAGFGWSMDIERNSQPVVSDSNPIEWAATDMTREEIEDAWEDRIDRLYGN